MDQVVGQVQGPQGLQGDNSDSDPPSTSSSEDEDQQGAVWGKKKKKTKKKAQDGRAPTLELDTDVETDLMDWVKGHEGFYKKKAKGWSHQKGFDYLWKEKAKSMGIENWKSLKTWWRSTRTRFSRLLGKKGKSGSGAQDYVMTPRDEFVWNHGSFLHGHIRAQVNRKPTEVLCAARQPQQQPKVHPQVKLELRGPSLMLWWW